MLSKDIIANVKKLKQSGEKVYSNCYIAFSREPERDWYTLDNDTSIAVIINEGGADRLYFYTTDFTELKKLIDECDRDTVIEIVSKNKDELECEMQQLGYAALAHLMRVANKDISDMMAEKLEFINDYDEASGIYAKPEDASEINRLLWNTFDTRVSHLLSDEELVEHIKNNEFVFCRNSSGDIVSLLQLVISNRSYYVNQVINSGDKDMFHSMVFNTMKRYNENGGKYAFAWVEENNAPSIHFFEKYGFTFDGLWNSVYIKN